MIGSALIDDFSGVDLSGVHPIVVDHWNFVADFVLDIGVETAAHGMHFYKFPCPLPNSNAG